MKKISIKKAFSKGWADYKKRPFYLLGLTLSTLALSIFVAGNNSGVAALVYILYGGFIAVLLKHAAGGTVSFDDLFEIVDKRWIYFAFLGVLQGLLIFIGLVFLIIPGIYLAVRWAFAGILVIDKGLRPVEALRASSELTAGVRWKMFGFLIINIALVALGLVAFIVGAVVAAIVCQLALIAVYRELSNPVPHMSVPEGEMHG